MARDFPGTNSNYLRIVNPVSAIDYAGSTLTVHCWVRPDTTTPATLVAKEPGTATTRGWQLGKHGTNISFFTFNSGGGVDAVAEVAYTTLGTGAWKAVAGRKNGTGAGAVALWIAGASVATTSASQANLNDTSADFTIGTRGVNDEPFNGQIQDVAVWSASLSDSELVALSKGVSPQMIRRASLIAHYPMWGDSSGTELDLSGNGQNVSEVGTVGVGSSNAPVGPLVVM
jgi:hypothetical protein